MAANSVVPMAKAVIASATSASGMTVSRVTPGQGRLGSGSTDEAGLVQVCPARVCGGRAAVEPGWKERVRARAVVRWRGPAYRTDQGFVRSES